VTEYSYPFGSSKINTEDEFSRMMMWAAPDGVCGSSNDTALKVTANGTSTVVVEPGEAFVRGQKYLLDAPKPLTVPPNATGAPRRDYVLLRNDPSNDKITAEYKTGGTDLPVLTRSWSGVWEVPLGAGTVASGTSAIQADAMADARWFTGWPAAPSVPASRPTPYKDRLLVEGNKFLIGNGEAWVPFDPIEDTGWVDLSMNGAQGSAWTPNTVCRVRKINRVVHLRFSIRRWATNGLGTDDPDGSVPINLGPDFRPAFTMFGSGFHSRSPVAVQVENTGAVRIYPLTADIPASRTVAGEAHYPVG
jgi:hypothetical protein